MKAEILSASAGVEAAVRVLRAGDVVALPTETVYGLGADALNPEACARIFEAKDRPLYDPLIVHVPEIGWLDRLACPSALARRLAEQFWPGPLTLILPRAACVPDIVTAGQETVALRMSAHPAFAAVAGAFGGPIAAPSANRFGRISPTTAEHVASELGDRITLILDGGACEHGLESTIVLVGDDDSLQILRPGPITASDLSRWGEIRATASDVAVPGGLKSHYAPHTPLTIQAGGGADLRAGLLAWQETRPGFGQVEVLSTSGDLREAAARLYGAMRRLDEAGLDRIVADPVPETGLGVAIMERLRKAAARE